MNNEWQPIETAPKDEMILLYGKIKDKNKIGIGSYYYALKFFVIEDGKGCYKLDATHWMPLPKPPETTQ